MDFRDEAELQTRRMLGKAPPISVDAELSGCLSVGTTGRRELTFSCVMDLVILLGGWGLCGICGIIVSFVGRERAGDVIYWGAIVVGTVSFVVGLGHTRLTAMWMKVRFARRQDRLFDPWLREAFQVNIEDPATHEETKVVIDDKAFCLPEPAQRRILLEGCAYRYVIHGRDVVNLRSVSMYAYAGVVLEYRLGETVLSLSITRPGRGFLSYVIIAFAGGAAARSLDGRFREALGMDRTD